MENSKVPVAAKITKKSIFERKEFTRNGKTFGKTGVSVQIEGKEGYWNGFLSDQEVLKFKNIVEGSTMFLMLSTTPKKEGEGVYKNFKYPSGGDMMELRMGRVENFIKFLLTNPEEQLAWKQYQEGGENA